MPKKIYFYFILILLIATTWSCTKEDTPLAIQNIETLPYITYEKGQTPAEIVFEIKGENGESNNIESVSFYKSLEVRIPRFPIDSIVRSPEKFLKKVNQVPSELSISIEDLIKDTEYGDIDDIPLGVKWWITWVVRLKDGQTIPSKSTTQIYFNCISDLEGRYIATNDFCQTPPLVLNIISDTLSGDRNRYIIPDITANHLAVCTNQDVPIPFTIRVNCNTIEPISRVYFGLRWTIIDGTWDDNSTLIIRWTDTFTLNGEIVTSTFVRQ
jgi:hypothetical protein